MIVITWRFWYKPLLMAMFKFLKDFKEQDVHQIRNPAYVVKEEHKDGCDTGCIIDCNEALVRFTNFSYEEIDKHNCHEVFASFWKDPDTKLWQKVCGEACRLRSGIPKVARDLWINSKSKKGEEIKRLVDIFVFPYKTEKNKFMMHIIINKNRKPINRDYFERVYAKLLI